MAYDFDRIVNRWGSDSQKWKVEKDVLSMSVADMDFQSPPAIQEALQKRVADGTFGYMVVPESYYESVIQWQRDRNHYTVEREWILYTSGVIAGLSIAIQALSDPGDQVIIQPPVYPPFHSVAVENGRELVKNPLICKDGEYFLDFEDLEKKAAHPKAKILLLCSPHNPIGRLWSREELARMGEICLRNGVVILSDEIHSDLIYRGRTFTPMAAVSKEVEANTVTCIAPSKTFNIPGLHHAIMLIPDAEKREKCNKISRKNHLTDGCLFGYYAAEAGFRHGAPWLEELMDYVEANYHYLNEYLKKHLPQVTCCKAEATYLAWLDFTGLGLCEEELNKLLERAKVKLGNGRDFSSDYALFKRVTLGCPRAYVEEMGKRLLKAIKE